MMKKYMVVCINPGDNAHFAKITKDKIYEVWDHSYDQACYRLICDDGVERGKYKWKFKVIPETLESCIELLRTYACDPIKHIKDIENVISQIKEMK